MKYHKEQNILCFAKYEIDSLFKATKSIELLQEMSGKKLTFDDLKANRAILEDIVDSIVATSGKDKDEVEIFVVTYMLLDFYEDLSECCFYMENGFNPEKDRIKDLTDLKRFIKEYSLVDFLILSKCGFRAFQLKRYRERLMTEDVFQFIVKKLNHYGNQLGDVNLLLLLQSQEAELNIDFKTLNKKINKLKLAFDGNILVWFNEVNKFDVIVEIYPKLRSRKLPIFPKE